MHCLVIGTIPMIAKVINARNFFTYINIRLKIIEKVSINFKVLGLFIISAYIINDEF